MEMDVFSGHYYYYIIYPFLNVYLVFNSFQYNNITTSSSFRENQQTDFDDYNLNTNLTTTTTLTTTIHDDIDERRIILTDNPDREIFLSILVRQEVVHWKKFL